MFTLTATLSLGAVIQSDVLKTFLPGDRVNLECLMSEQDGNYYNWIKIIIEQAPVLMLSLYFHSNTATFFGEFINSTRFTETKSGTRFVLTISDARPSDMGMYYCAARDYDAMIFRKGICLVPTTIPHSKSVSESVQPGDSVTPNCTIHTEACVGKHSIYWFRHGSGESRPGIIYTYGDWSDQCEKSPEAGSPTQSCVYNLPKRNLSLSDAGTCYCAVIEETALTFLYCCLYFHRKCVFFLMTLMNCKQILSSNYLDQEDDDTLTSVHYAALNVIHKKPKTRRQRSTMETDTVFSGVRCQNMD
uniref:Novel immune-type receptor 12 n=1 Tax=Salmo trutta TaxID=8032 RepID=A0A673VL20_SALTR